MSSSRPLVGVLVSLSSLSLLVSPARATPSYQCHPSVKPLHAKVGKRGQYEVKTGLRTSKYYGFLDRKPIRPKNGCFFSGLKSGQCIVMHYKIAGYEKTRLDRQCVLSDSGKSFRRARPTRRGPLSGQDILTKCPNGTGYKCDAGHNSARRKKYEKALKSKGLMVWSFCARGANNRLDKNIGKKVFCQMYDKKSNKAVFAVEYTWVEPPK